jgi:hypothetical protein
MEYATAASSPVLSSSWNVNVVLFPLRLSSFLVVFFSFSFSFQLVRRPLLAYCAIPG